jgi:hypothetical protein
VTDDRRVSARLAASSSGGKGVGRLGVLHVSAVAYNCCGYGRRFADIWNS